MVQKNMDKIDKKIIECLKKGSNNKTGLFRYAFPREGQRVFNRRIDNLEKDGIIIITKEGIGGKSLIITLAKKTRRMAK